MHLGCRKLPNKDNDAPSVSPWLKHYIVIGYSRRGEGGAQNKDIDFCMEIRMWKREVLAFLAILGRWHSEFFVVTVGTFVFMCQCVASGR